jgi:hypothetical protein
MPPLISAQLLYRSLPLSHKHLFLHFFHNLRMVTIALIDGLGGSAFCGWLLVAVLAGFGVLGWLSALGASAATIAPYFLRWLAECLYR